MPSEPQFDEREDPAERAIHDVYEAVYQAWRVLPEETANWIVLCANIRAKDDMKRLNQS